MLTTVIKEVLKTHPVCWVSDNTVDPFIACEFHSATISAPTGADKNNNTPKTDKKRQILAKGAPLDIIGLIPLNLYA